MIASMEKPAWLHDGPSFMSSRTYRFLRLFFGVSLVFIILNFYVLDLRSHVNRQAQNLGRGANTKIQNATLNAASNSTLGFDSIQFVNLPGRFDRSDAATIQAYLSGLDITEVPGVLADDIHEVGMPPSHRNTLKKGEKGCWRAHANIWAQMLRDKTPAVLVMESDTAWDLNVREIMRNLNEHFTYFLHQLNSTPVHNGGYDARNAPKPGPGPILLNPDDPWHSEHWDLLSLGQCFENKENSDVRVIYPDEFIEPGKDYFGRPLGAERVVRKSGGIVCTTAYAVSQTGAAKLLLRSAVDLDNPVDLIMRRLIISDDLLTYSVMPTVFAQWEYKDKIGQDERGANSDINGEDNADGDINLEGWDEVKESGSVWQAKGFHPDVAFTHMALEKAWSLIMPDAVLQKSQYDEATGN